MCISINWTGYWIYCIIYCYWTIWRTLDWNSLFLWVHRSVPKKKRESLRQLWKKKKIEAFKGLGFLLIISTNTWQKDVWCLLNFRIAYKMNHLINKKKKKSKFLTIQINWKYNYLNSSLPLLNGFNFTSKHF